MATLTAYISVTKYDIHNRASALTATWVSYIVSKRHVLWSTNGFKVDPNFYSLYVTSAFYFIARLCRQTNKRNSTKLCQTVDSLAITICRSNVGVVPPEKNNSVGQKLLHLFGFPTTSRPSGEYLQNEMWHRQVARAFKSTKYLLRCPKILWRSTNGLKLDWSLYPPWLFHFVPVHRTPSMRH